MKKKLICVLLAGCMAMAPVTAGFAAEATTEAASEGEKKTEYPLTISNFNYEKEAVEETFEKAPEKVITFWNNSVETMLALGLGDRVISAVGVDESSILPELQEEFDKMVAGKEYNAFTDSNAAMSKEYAIMLEPDFILGWKSTFSDKTIGDVDYWQENGVNTYIALNSNDISEYRTVENEYTDILTLGEIFDVQDKAEAIVDDIKAVIDNTLEATKDVEEKPTVMVLEPLGEDITNYGASSLGGDMVTKLGATLANPDASTVGKEDIIAANPDVIFVVYMPYAGDDPQSVLESQMAVIQDDEALQSLDAVKNGRVYPIMLSEMYASATRTQDGVETFAKGLYPDVAID